MVREPWAIADMVRKPWAIAIIAAVAVAIATALGIVLHVPNPGISAAVAQRQPDVSHGEYIYRLADCAACHTKPGGETLAGGLPLVTPMGTIYTTNITPDRDTGIGDYSFTDFARAVRLGVRPDGTRLYPAMPYTSYAKMSDEDLQDLFGYLQKSVAPVKATAPATDIGVALQHALAACVLERGISRQFPFHARSIEGCAMESRRLCRGGAGALRRMPYAAARHAKPRTIRRNLPAPSLQGWKAYNITGQRTVGHRRLERRRARRVFEHRTRRRPQLGERTNGRGDRRQLALCQRRRHSRRSSSICVDPGHRERTAAIAQNPPAATEASRPQGSASRCSPGNCANCHDWNGKGVQSPYASLARQPHGRTIPTRPISWRSCCPAATRRCRSRTLSCRRSRTATRTTSSRRSRISSMPISATARAASPPPTSTRRANRCRRH